MEDHCFILKSSSYLEYNKYFDGVKLLVSFKSSIGKIGKSGSLCEKELKALINLAEDFNATYMALLPVMEGFVCYWAYNKGFLHNRSDRQ